MTSDTSLPLVVGAVRAVLGRSDGEEEIVETPWLIGCDGAHSATRYTLGINFEGAQYDESFILADVQLVSSLARDRVHLFLGDDGVLGVIPFAKDFWRIVANIPPESRIQELPEVTLSDVQELLDQRAAVGLQASAPVWLSRFHISHRKVRQFRQLRVFLAGDAAHIHMDALPFCRATLVGVRCPLGPYFIAVKSYPIQPTTVGEAIRKRRLDLNLRQVDAAKLIGCNEMTIVNWENGHTRPCRKKYSAIRMFLGEVPKEWLVWFGA